MSIAFTLQNPFGGPPIAFREAIPESPTPQTAGDAASIERNYLVAWGQWTQAEAALLGTVQRRLSPGGTPYLTRRLPHADLEKPYLHARRVSRIRGEAARAQRQMERGGAAGYEDARLSVTYEYPGYDVVDDTLTVNPDFGGGLPDEALLRRFVVFDSDPAVQVFLMRGGGFRWIVAGAPPILEGTPINLYSSSLTYQWMFVPRDAVPKANILATVSKSNSDVFDGIPIGQAVLESWKPTRPFKMPDGQAGVHITYKIRHRAQGANFFPRPGEPNIFCEVSQDGLAGGARPHPPAPFAVLFRPI